MPTGFEKRLLKLEKQNAQRIRRQLLEPQHAHDWEKICRTVASFDAGPLYWFTAHTKTEDQHWLSKGTSPVSPFPKKDYFVPVLEWTMKHDVTACYRNSGSHGIEAIERMRCFRIRIRPPVARFGDCHCRNTD